MPSCEEASDHLATSRTSSRSLNIALLGYRSNPYSGGQGIYLKHLAKALTDAGHSVDVISGEPYPELDPGINLIKLPGLNLFAAAKPFRALQWRHLLSVTDLFEWLSFNSGGFPEPYTFGRRLLRYLRQSNKRYDIIHDNQCLAPALLTLQRQNIPVVATIHHPITVDRKLELEHARTPWERFGKRRWYAFTKMQTRVAQRMPRILSVSENSKQDISADKGVDLDKIHVVPVGVDPDLFLPVPGVERRPGHIVTTASADVAMKGLKFLLEAVAKLRTERHMELTIIGKRRPDSHASQTMTALGLDDCVNFVSGVPDERIVELYSEAELACVPSLYEGFSLPAIEAMSCGVPLVCTTGGALPEVTGTHGETCFQTEPGNSDALAATIREALDNPELRDKVGAAGRERVKSQWSWRHTAIKTVDQYRAVLDEHAARVNGAG